MAIVDLDSARYALASVDKTYGTVTCEKQQSSVLFHDLHSGTTRPTVRQYHMPIGTDESSSVS